MATNSQVLQYLLSLMLQKITVPTGFHNQCDAVKTMQEDDVTGLIDSLVDFSINSASVKYFIETENSEYNEKLAKWLENINIEYAGMIPSGVKALSTEYFKERWKYSSFPVLKIADWDSIDGSGMIFPTKMFFVDGSSIHAKKKEGKEEGSLLAYNYFLGRNTENKLDKNVIFSRPYGRWFDKYPTPYLIKRGIYHNYKLIQNIKEKEGKILNQIIPYLLQITKGDKDLVKNNIKSYGEADLKEVIGQFQELMDEIKSTSEGSKQIKSPIRASNFDEQIKHLIPDISSMFDEKIFAVAEKNILTGLGFIDIAEAVSSSRRESVLNPKGFIEEIKKGIDDFKNHILKQLYYQIQQKNKEHRKYANLKVHIGNSPVRGFMTDDFKNQLRLLWKNGQLSNETYCEMVGEVEFETEKIRRDKELRDGTEIVMYPHITQNNEEKQSPQEIKRENIDKEEDKNGTPLPPDKTEPEEKEEYDIGKLEIAPYKNIKELPKSVKDNMSKSLQSVFVRVFNKALEQYDSEEKAFRVAWSAIRDIGRKNDKGIWVRKSNKKIKTAKINKLTNQVKRETKDE